MDETRLSNSQILQEITAARSISIMYGDEELPGAVFVRGMQELYQNLFKADSVINTHVSTVIDLMARAPPAPSVHMSTQILDVAPLADLVEMFHMSSATDRRDKVYALLGLQSNRLANGTLVPDYEKTWASVFKELIEHVLGSHTISKTWEDSERAVLTGSGCTIGYVASVERHVIEVKSKDTSFSILWDLQAPLKQVKENDIVCLLEGSTHPTVIRPCGDHFDVIIVSLSSIPRIKYQSQTPGPKPAPGLVSSLIQAWFSDREVAPRHNFLLVWDWERLTHHTRKDHYRLISRFDRAERGPSPNVPNCDTPWLRRLNIRRVLDDVQLNNKEKWESSSDLPYCADGESTTGLHRIYLIVSFFERYTSYTWLRSYAMDLRHMIQSLRGSHQMYTPSFLVPHHPSEMITGVGAMVYDWAYRPRKNAGILGLVELEDQVFSDVRNHEDARTSLTYPWLWDFNETAHEDLLCRIFPRYRQASQDPLHGESVTSNGVLFNGRYIMKLVSKQEGLDSKLAQSMWQDFDALSSRFLVRSAPNSDAAALDMLFGHQQALILAALSEACGGQNLANANVMKTLKYLRLEGRGLVVLAFVFGELWHNTAVVCQIFARVFVPAERGSHGGTRPAFKYLKAFLDYQGRNIIAHLTRLDVASETIMRDDPIFNALWEQMYKGSNKQVLDLQTISERVEARDRVRKWFMEF
jgi:hypothetical protein